MTTPRPFSLALLLVLFAAGAARCAEPGIDAGGARFPVPASWVAVPPMPASAARVAQWDLPQGGQAVAFYFGEGKGGDVQKNMASLARRVTTPTGGPAPLTGEGTATRKTTGSAGAVQTAWFACYGLYTGDPLRSGIPSLPRPDWGLIGLVAEFPGGPVYFRITGPEATVRAVLAQPRFGRPGGILFPALLPPPPPPAPAPVPASASVPAEKSKK